MENEKVDEKGLASRVEELEQEIADRDGIIRGLQDLLAGKGTKSLGEIRKRLKETRA